MLYNNKENILEILDFVGLSSNLKKKTGKYSLGMKQRLGTGLALIGHPDFLILDEPINGLDPQGILYFSGETYSLVLLDLMLPGMAGESILAVWGIGFRLKRAGSGLFPGAVHAHRYSRGKIQLVSASGVELHRAFTELDIDVYQTDSKDDPDYTGRNLDSTSFDVIIEEPGEYKVCFRATEFVGNYEINWRTGDNKDN